MGTWKGPASARSARAVTVTDAAPPRPAAWRCPKCNRAFARTGQRHSCRTVSLEQHLPQDGALRGLFDDLLQRLDGTVGPSEVVTLPCCVHLCGTYDYLAVLPRRDRLEVRFALDREVVSPRIKRSERISANSFKHSIDLGAAREIDEEFLRWVREAYHLRDG
jgi:hypothetical protein